MQILTTIALIVIGVLFFMLIIFSHELGHFITAKLSGVRVNEFSIGMGPRLFGFKKGETEYSFRLLPIGGYCAMEGEDEDSEDPKAFNNAKVWKRMIIIIAGAVMNILLGFILMFAHTVQADNYASTTVTQFVPYSFSAYSGLQEGDRIVDINGYSIWNYTDLKFAISTLQPVEADGKTLVVYKQSCANEACVVYTKLFDEFKLDENTAPALYNILSSGCEKIKTAKTKQESKLLLDELCDKMYAHFGVKDYELPNITEKDTRKLFQADVKVIRNDEEITLEDVQFFTQYTSEENEKAGKVSVSIDFYVDSIEKNVGSVLTQTFSETCSMAKTVWTSLVWLVQGRFSFNELSGPVGIATAVTHVASQGLMEGFGTAVNNILFVMILITVNLGIVNMLPFPALDGGRFLFLLIEWIFRKPIPRKVEQIVNTAGLVILMLFILIVSFKDVWQLITGNLPIM